jgi:hypothetical protein
MDSEGCQIAVRAAGAYAQARENASYERPFAFGFYAYLAEEQMRWALDEAAETTSGSRASSPPAAPQP